MRRIPVLAISTLLLTTAARAHVTPTVELVRKGELVRSTLPGATHFFERSADSLASVLQRVGGKSWHPSPREVKVYVGRDDQDQLIGSVVFLRVPSAHGPVGLGVAFDPSGSILRAAVTEVGSEPLAWVRPLLDAHALDALAGRPAATEVDPTTLAPSVEGKMSRYYAGVIARGVERAGEVLAAAALAPEGATD